MLARQTPNLMVNPINSSCAFWSLKQICDTLMIKLPSLCCIIASAFLGAVSTISHASNSADRIDNYSQQDLSQINATPHELAFLQVLSEICPPMLNSEQKRLFSKAYQEQLVYFMPNINATAAMHQISSQREYRRALDWARKWTKTFPREENRALCIEFAESSLS